MKAILSLRKHGYLKTIGTFLIAIALIAGVVGCTGEGPVEYELTIDSTAGGEVTAPGEGTYTYDDGEVVDLVATPDSGYAFDKWTGDTGTINDVNAATTNITMNADYSITANFQIKTLDHFKCYEVDMGTAPYIGEEVQLVDQFGTFNATVGYPEHFGNPVAKIHNDMLTPISDDNDHLTFYGLSSSMDRQVWDVTVKNQFGDNQELTVWGPVTLAVPTTKEDHGDPGSLDHFLVYDVISYENAPEDVTVEINDQFTQELVQVRKPVGFANPVQKTRDDEVTEIEMGEHLVLYEVEDEPFQKIVHINNQFGPQTLDVFVNVSNPPLLAVPSQKISWEQPLDHFKCYWASWAAAPPMYGEPVQLEDQLVTIDATVNEPYLFANPVWKLYGGMGTGLTNYNHHLTFYYIGYQEDPQAWNVTVSNQFGNNQWLQVVGPLWLAVPTQKDTLDPPVDLDHFLVYIVVDWTWSPEVQVRLTDQFNMFSPQDVWVHEPGLFAVPAQKIHDEVITPINNPAKHLLFYWIDGGELYEESLPIANQFGQQLLDVSQSEEDLLGVPSEKIEVSEPFPAPL